MLIEARELIWMDVTSATRIASAKTTLKLVKLRTNRPKIVNNVTWRRAVGEELRTI